jgi:RNA polymerase sigma-70 factor (ECF subfamily)
MDEIIRAHSTRLLRLAAAILKNRADAEDAVQDTFVRLVTHAPEFESEAHRTAWLNRVAMNICKSRLRWWKRRPTTELTESYPAQSYEQSVLVQSVLFLPTKYRIVIHLHYFEGYSTAEIAEITRQKESTVRQQLTRARRLLKDLIKEDLA